MYMMNNFYIVFGKYKFNLIIIILCVFILFVFYGHLLCGCSKMSAFEAFETVTGNKIDIKLKNKKTKEGFAKINNTYLNTGETFGSYPEIKTNTSNWMNPNLNHGSLELSKLNSYKNTQLPLRDNNMFMFSQTDFKPECCKYGQSYSNSMGCACLNLDSVKYLWQRGGNNIPLVQGSTV